jgi:hypothetical protein
MTQAEDEEKTGGIRGVLKGHGAQITLAILIGYLILLGIGVTAEVFKIQSILDWWIFKAPSR